jgi:hypothetical protein
MVSQPIVWLIVGVSLFVATPVFLWGCYALVLSTLAIRNAVWLRRTTPTTPDDASTGRVLLAVAVQGAKPPSSASEGPPSEQGGDTAPDHGTNTQEPVYLHPHVP